MDRVFHMVAFGFPVRHDSDFLNHAGYFPSPNLARQVSLDLGSPGVPRSVNPHMGDTVQAWSAGVHLARQVRLDSGSDFQSVDGGGAGRRTRWHSQRPPHPPPIQQVRPESRVCRWCAIAPRAPRATWCSGSVFQQRAAGSGLGG